MCGLPTSAKRDFCSCCTPSKIGIYRRGSGTRPTVACCPIRGCTRWLRSFSPLSPPVRLAERAGSNKLTRRRGPLMGTGVTQQKWPTSVCLHTGQPHHPQAATAHPPTDSAPTPRQRSQRSAPTSDHPTPTCSRGAHGPWAALGEAGDRGRVDGRPGGERQPAGHALGMSAIFCGPLQILWPSSRPKAGAISLKPRASAASRS